MNDHSGRTAAIAAVGALLLTLPTGTATAAPARPASHITVHASDTTPQSGQQLVLRGRLTTTSAQPLAGGTVRVQSLSGGAWSDLTGAHVTTAGDGRYRVRVVLSQRGERTLRVVGDPAGDSLRNSRARIALTVS
jgi:hypothetical protein